MNSEMIAVNINNVEAIDIVEFVTKNKINHYEKLITAQCSEEDIKSKEAKIRKLQDHLNSFRKELRSAGKSKSFKMLLQQTPRSDEY